MSRLFYMKDKTIKADVPYADERLLLHGDIYYELDPMEYGTVHDEHGYEYLSNGVEFILNTDVEIASMLQQIADEEIINENFAPAREMSRASRRKATARACSRSKAKANWYYYGCPEELGRYAKANPVLDHEKHTHLYDSLATEKANAKANDALRDFYATEIEPAYVPEPELIDKVRAILDAMYKDIIMM